MIIPQNLLEEIYEHAESELPIEACGYLFGNDGAVKEVYKMTNVDQSHEHFALDPKEQFAAVKNARNSGFEILAVYHSHPETPARPSQEDIKLAYDPNISYVIASLKDGGRDIKSFRVQSGQVTPEELLLDPKEVKLEPEEVQLDPKEVELESEEVKGR